MNFIAQWVPVVLEYGAYIVAAASVVSQMTPNQTDNNIVAVLQKVFSFMALNWGSDKVAK